MVNKQIAFEARNNVIEQYPKISIITPNLNQAQYLEATINSVLFQNYPNLEYIIIDGGSTDGSIDIIKKYERHLAWWVSEPDRGLYDAIQKGFSRSTGEIMAWLNSDDLYHKNALRTAIRIFNKFPEIEWITGVLTTFDEVGHTVDVREAQTWSKLNFLNFDFMVIQQESTIWRRNLWEKAGSRIDTSLKLAGDLELWLRFFSFSKLYTVPILIGGFRQRSKNQMSLDFYNEYLKEARRCIKMELLKHSAPKKLQFQIAFHLDYFCRNTPLVRRFYNLYRFREKHLGYPRQLKFNRISQEFTFE